MGRRSESAAAKGKRAGHVSLTEPAPTSRAGLIYRAAAFALLGAGRVPTAAPLRTGALWVALPALWVTLCEFPLCAATSLPFCAEPFLPLWAAPFWVSLPSTTGRFAPVALGTFEGRK